MRRFSFLALFIALFSLVSCHNKSAPSSAITCTTSVTFNSCTDPVSRLTITIAPGTTSVSADSSAPITFSSFLIGSTNNVVIWKINGVVGGNQTVGTIDSNGIYLAPSVVPSPATVTVTAVSFQEQTLSVDATLTILPPPAVTINPTSATLVAGAGKTFTATVTGAPTTNVNWLVNNVQGGNAASGQIDSNGNYTAPLSPPLGGTVTVTAASRDFPQVSASATVTISGFSAKSLSGSYAFSVSGKIASGAFFRAGRFTADGAGNLTSGLEDIHDASGVTTAISFAGTYTVGPDGRGTMQFFGDSHSPSIFSIALVNNSQVQISALDATGTATGQADLQNPSTFGTFGSAGTYVFDFSGQDGSLKPLSQIGEFTFDGIGGIQSGLQDINDNGVITSQVPFTGTYSAVNLNGRGTATLSGMTFSFYVVSRASAKFVEIDSGSRGVAGFIAQQAPNATFDLTSLNGNFAFLLTGSTSTGKIATAGTIAANGNGNITTGVLDENANGVATPNVPFVNGTYTVASTGRGTATFTTTGRTYTLVFYLGPTVGNSVIQETDSSIASDGLIVKQQAGAFVPASVQGSYSLQSNGQSGASVQTITGQLKSGGAGTIPSGTIDINTAGTLIPGEAVSGVYTVGANSRGTLTLNPSGDNRNFAIYVVNSNQAIVLGVDTARLAAGQLFRQF